MKTKTVKSFGSLVVRGKRFYAFWRVKDSTGKSKAICKALRDEHGAPITTRPEAERAKLRLMEIVHKEKQVASLRSIAHLIDDTQADIQRLQDEQHPALTLNLAWAAFAKSTERHDCSQSTLREYEHKWTAFVEWIEREHPTITTLRDLDKVTARAYMENLNCGKIAPATFNFHLMTLKYIFSVLKDDAKLPVNVWEGVKRKINIPNTRRELTIDELRKVCQSATGELRMLLCIGLYTGLRLGDCCTLRWCEVDLRRNQIRRIPNKTARKNPKTITIPIHPVLRDMLAKNPANERNEFVSPKTAKIYLNGSRPIITRSIQRHFKTCGIRTTKANTNGSRAIIEVGFHSLRHTFVSMAREAGAALSVVESLVGHNSVDMTRYYTHTSELAASNAVALLPSVNGDTVEATKQTRDELLRELVESMTTRNLREKKRAALAILATATTN
jgi:integrase